MLDDILDFSKIESGKMEIVPVEYDLVKLLNDIANVSLVRLEGKNVELRLELDPLLPAHFTGDDIRIRQILINLAGNASKFTEKGFITIRAEKLSSYEKRKGLRISVIDTGVGIKDEDVTKLFAAFRQVDMTMNRTKGGTGLGLSISKRLCELMGGSIGVKSVYGKGSVFYISIPQESVGTETCAQKYAPLFDAALPGTEDKSLKLIPVVSLLNKPEFAGLFVEKNSSSGFTAPAAKVLVVDDNEVNIQVADGLLKKLGINAECVTSGFAALEEIAEKDFNVIFMDHQMPVMDGVETLRKIRDEEKESGKHRTVVALSANAVNGAREMFIQNGFDDFLAKPVQGKDFALCLEKWLPSDLIIYNESDKKEETIVFPENFPSWNKEKLDVETAAANSGSLENWLKTVVSYYGLIEKNSSIIKDALEENLIKDYTIQVHALKSSSRIIGAEKLGALAEKLELLGKEVQAGSEGAPAFKEGAPVETAGGEAQIKTAGGEAPYSFALEQIKKLTPELLSLYKSYKEELAPFVNFMNQKAEKKAALPAGGFDSAWFDSLIKKMLSACKKRDLDTIEDGLSALKSAAFDSPLSPKMEEFEEAVNDIEFKEIERILTSVSSVS